MSTDPPSAVPSADASLASVWHCYGEQLRRRARTRLRQYGLTGQTESMDICNDVMADLMARGVHAEHPDQVLGYLLRAIDHQIVDTFRTLSRQCRDFRRNESLARDSDAALASSLTPSQVALRRDVFERIREILPEGDSRAVDMMLENRDWQEIGAALGINADAARMRVRRAIDVVRRMIGVAEDVPS